MFKRILVAIDDSPTADRGLKTAIELAADQRAKLYIVHVLDDVTVVPGFFDGDLIPPEYYDRMIESMREAGRKLLAKAERLALKRGVEVQARFVETLGQRVARTILDEADNENADVIVLGTYGRRGARRLLLGGDAEAVLRESRVPVLLVRSPEDEKPQATLIKPGALLARSDSTAEARSEPDSQPLPTGFQTALVRF